MLIDLLWYGRFLPGKSGARGNWNPESHNREKGLGFWAGFYQEETDRTVLIGFTQELWWLCKCTLFNTEY